MTEELKVASSPEVVNLTEVDNLLKELDPEFNSNLEKINAEIGQIGPIAGLESITLSADYLKEGAEGSEAKDDEIAEPPTLSQEETKAEDPDQGDSFLRISKDFLWVTALLLPKLAIVTYKLALGLKSNPPLVVVKSAPEAFLPPLTEWGILFQAFFQKVRTYSFATYFKVFLMVVLLGLIRFTLHDMKNRFSPDQVRDPFLKNWAEVADHSFAIPIEAQGENIDDPLRHLEYTVLIPKIIANLKPPNRRASPMVTAELYIEVSNQDAAIEVRDRDREVRDSLERVFEGTTFDELDTKEGKEKLKIHIRSSLDQMLNKGHVKRVFFSSLNMVP